MVAEFRRSRFFFEHVEEIDGTLSVTPLDEDLRREVGPHKEDVVADEIFGIKIGKGGGERESGLEE